MNKKLQKIALIFSAVVLTTPVLRAQWTATSGPTVSTTVDFLTTDNSAIYASVNGVYKTTDNGATWTNSSNGLAGMGTDVIFIDGSKIYVGVNSGVYVSTDAGANWTSAGATTKGVISFAKSGTTLLAGTSGAGVYISTDNGVTWNTSNTGLTNLDVNALVVVGTKVFAGTKSGIFKSSDNGASWTNTTPGGAPVVLSMATDGVNIFVGCQNFSIITSGDNGATWAVNNTGLPSSTETVECLLHTGSVWMAGLQNNGVYMSVDSGATWSDISAGLALPKTVNALVLKGTTVYLGTNTNAYGVWKRDLSNLTAIKDSYSNSSVEIYPNPANEQLSLAVSSYKNATAEIYELSGRILANVQLENATTRIETINLAKGIYFLKIKSAEGTTIRKFVKD